MTDYYMLAAKLGHTGAMKKIAIYYAEKNDQETSLVWSRRAAALGDEEAVESLGGDFVLECHDNFIDAIRTNGHFGEIDQDAVIASIAA